MRYFVTLLGVLEIIRYIARMRDWSDERLMQHYAKGDATAFETLYQRHRGPLYRYFLRQLNDPAAANDLYQGAWEKIIRARLKYRTSAPFKSWMYRIAHNHLVDHYRRQRPAEPLDEEAMESVQSNPAQAAMGGEDRERLRAGILGLPPEQRDALLLKLESGLKMEDIASVTGVSRETVKSRLRYAVAKLKQVMGE